jgi:hypothetical protein
MTATVTVALRSLLMAPALCTFRVMHTSTASCALPPHICCTSCATDTELKVIFSKRQFSKTRCHVFSTDNDGVLLQLAACFAAGGDLVSRHLTDAYGRRDVVSGRQDRLVLLLLSWLLTVQLLMPCSCCHSLYFAAACAAGDCCCWGALLYADGMLLLCSVSICAAAQHCNCCKQHEMSTKVFPLNVQAL